MYQMRYSNSSDRNQLYQPGCILQASYCLNGPLNFLNTEPAFLRQQFIKDVLHESRLLISSGNEAIQLNGVYNAAGKTTAVVTTTPYVFFFIIQLDRNASLLNLQRIEGKPNYKFIEVNHYCVNIFLLYFYSSGGIFYLDVLHIRGNYDVKLIGLQFLLGIFN